MSHHADPARVDTVIGVVGEVVADAVAITPEHDVIPPNGSYSSDHTLSLTVHPGGGPANTALALARLGSTARFAARLSTGSLGRLARARLAESGVDLRASVAVDAPATLAVTTLGPDGGAEYEFYVSGTADWGWSRAELARLIDPGLGPHPAAIHTGTLALSLQPPGPLIEELLARARPRATISIDPNLRTALIPVATYRQAIDRWARLADIVKLSSDDLATLWPGTSFTDAARRIHDSGAALVVITRGGDGSFASLRTNGYDENLAAAPHPTDIVDTVGAGDTFTAGLLHRLGTAGALGGRIDRLDRDTLGAALDFAARVAAVTCSRPGADPPWAHDLDRRTDKDAASSRAAIDTRPASDPRSLR